MRSAKPAQRTATARTSVPKARVALAVLATYATFGSSPAATQAAIHSVPPLLIMAIRGLAGGAVLLGWSMLAGTRRPTGRQWLAALLFGTLTLALGSGVSTIGQRTVSSGIVGVLSATMPLFAAILGYALFRERIPRLALVGLIAGFVGIALLIRPGSQLDPVGVALVIAAQASWALGAVLAPRLAVAREPRLAAGTELLCGGAVLVVATAVLGEFSGFDPRRINGSAWLGLVWLSANAVLGFAAYGFLLKSVSTALSSTFSYVNPIVAVFLGSLLYSEPVTTRMLLATAVVVAGVCLIVSSPRTGERPANGRA